MKAARLLAVLFVSVGFFANRAMAGADLGTVIDFSDFTKMVEGDYQIDSVNGVSPKTENNGGSIISEDEEVVFTFGYCNNGPCDPGYILLPKKPTGTVTVYDKELDTKARLYTIVFKDGLDDLTYEMEFPADNKDFILFRRFNYEYNGNPPVTLVHKLKRL